MKSERIDKSVSNMEVLKDIRGLLSVTRERDGIAAGGESPEKYFQSEMARLEAQVKEYKELIQKQQSELQMVVGEKEQLAAKLKAMGSGVEKPVPVAAKSPVSDEEALQLEARIAELSSALSQIEDLIKLRSQELLQKIARLFQEAGQGEVSIEFRKTASALESVENSAHFLQELFNL